MFVKSIKNTLYSISISLLVVSAITYLSEAHLEDETLADMLFFGIISVPFLVALNYGVLACGKMTPPVSSEADAAKANMMAAETAAIAELSVVEKNEPSTPRKRSAASGAKRALINDRY